MTDATLLTVTGATGRMGRAVVTAVVDRADVEVTVAVARRPDTADLPVPVADASDLPELLADRDSDVLVDFTAPDATRRHVASAAEAGVACVVGTTGLDDATRDALDRAAGEVPVLHATNFSRGVAALRRATRAAVRACPDHDVEVTETHHDGKRDAPSGTALSLVADVERAVGESRQRVHGREGDQPRSSGEVGVHARRAGDVTGEHEVLLAGDDEVLTLGHRVESRRVFAVGALDAAAWLAGRSPGSYDFTEVLE